MNSVIAAMVNTTPMMMPIVVIDVSVNRNTTSDTMSQITPVTMNTHHQRAAARTSARTAAAIAMATPPLSSAGRRPGGPGPETLLRSDAEAGLRGRATIAACDDRVDARRVVGRALVRGLHAAVRRRGVRWARVLAVRRAHLEPDVLRRLRAGELERECRAGRAVARRDGELHGRARRDDERRSLREVIG